MLGNVAKRRQVLPPVPNFSRVWVLVPLKEESGLFLLVREAGAGFCPSCGLLGFPK